MQSKSKHQLKHSYYQQVLLKVIVHHLLSKQPNQLISELNLTVPSYLYHYHLIITTLDLQSVCLNLINQLPIILTIQLQFMLKSMISFINLFLPHLYGLLVASSWQSIMPGSLLKMSSELYSFNSLALNGILTPLCSSSSCHFELLVFTFLRLQSRLILPIHHFHLCLVLENLFFVIYVSFQRNYLLMKVHGLLFCEAALDGFLA